MEIVEDFAKAFNDQQAHKEMNFEETEDNATGTISSTLPIRVT